jgi:hypothetical protein
MLTHQRDAQARNRLVCDTAGRIVRGCSAFTKANAEFPVPQSRDRMTPVRVRSGSCVKHTTSRRNLKRRSRLASIPIHAEAHTRLRHEWRLPSTHFWRSNDLKWPPADGLASTAGFDPLPAFAFRGSGDWRQAERTLAFDARVTRRAAHVVRAPSYEWSGIKQVTRKMCGLRR